MSNIISISSQEDWNTMSLLKGSLSYYRDNNQTGKYNKAIEREGTVYAEYLSKIKVQ